MVSDRYVHTILADKPPSVVVLLLSFWFVSLAGCYQTSPDPAPQLTVDTLQRLLHDSDVVVRRTAAEALGKIGNPQVVPELVLALGDDTALVREASVWSLSGLGPLDSAARGRIAGLLVDPSPAVRTAAAQTLASLDMTKELWPAALSQLSHEDPEVRRVVIQAFQSINALEAVGALEPLLYDPASQVRRAAVVTLAETGDSRVVELFRRLLSADPSADVRAEIAYRLQFFSGSEVSEGLSVAAGEDKNDQVRRWAEQSLTGLQVHGSGSTPQPIQQAAPAPSRRYP